MIHEISVSLNVNVNIKQEKAEDEMKNSDSRKTSGFERFRICTEIFRTN